jgi:Zn-dependent M32 family carboxypeptidase
MPKTIPAGWFLNALARQWQAERVAEGVDAIYDMLMEDYEDATSIDDLPRWFREMVEDLSEGWYGVPLSNKVLPREDEV